ncbi:MAG: aldo/keto reductase [Chloroflexi bacterium]|nr:aldo/keto reductase [Chloroflexota bacterium]
MEMVRLGKTGLMVSRLGFGGIPIQRLGEAEAVLLVKRCLELGINFYDTANAYTTSEGFIGKAIDGRREELVLATKSTSRNPEKVMKHLQLSLERLGVDTIDLYQLHGVDDLETYNSMVASGGMLTTLEKARSQEKIRHIGISSHSLDVAKLAAQSGHFETVQFPFNFVAREAADELIPLCRRNDVGFIAMKPMGGGMLESASLAMKFLMQFPGVHPIVGVDTIEQMEELVRIVEGDLSITPEEQRRMEQIATELGSRYCRHCYYCQPCPQDILICEVMVFPTYLKRSVPAFYLSGWVADNMEKAQTCTECGECEGRCPFKLPIREMLGDSVALFRKLKTSAT